MKSEIRNVQTVVSPAVHGFLGDLLSLGVLVLPACDEGTQRDSGANAAAGPGGAGKADDASSDATVVDEQTCEEYLDAFAVCREEDPETDCFVEMASECAFSDADNTSPAWCDTLDASGYSACTSQDEDEDKSGYSYCIDRQLWTCRKSDHCTTLLWWALPSLEFVDGAANGTLHWQDCYDSDTDALIHQTTPWFSPGYSCCEGRYGQP